MRHRADWVANILLFIPLSYLWIAGLTVDYYKRMRRFLSSIILVFLCSMLALVIEFTQLFFPRRTTSINDILAETIGACVGIFLWSLFGQSITNSIRQYSRETRPLNKIEWLLAVYCFGLIFYSILPLDLILSLTELAYKFRAGRIQLLPFGDFSLNPNYIYNLLRDIVVFIPVGIFISLLKTKNIRSFSSTITLGFIFVSLLELSQILVYSRFTSTGDIILGVFGVGIGAHILRYFKKSPNRDETIFTDETRSFWISMLLVLIYSLLLIVIFCMPFDLITDNVILKARLRGFWHVPFARLYTGSEFNAISEILRKIILYLPLGAILASSVRNLSFPTVLKRLILVFSIFYVMGLATFIELLQVFIKSHVPDCTDVILCPLGGILGMFLVYQIIPIKKMD